MYDYKLTHSLKEKPTEAKWPFLVVVKKFQSLQMFLSELLLLLQPLQPTPRPPPRPPCPWCHVDFHADLRLLSSASLTSVILLTRPSLSNWSNFPPWLWWMCPALTPCPSTLAGLIKENIPWLPIFPRAWQPIILPSTWLESYYA